MDTLRHSRAVSAPPMASRRRSPERIAWVDTAKGICIIFVVMMHSTLGVGTEMGGEGFMHWVVAFAKPFRMPDFFLISGLFLGRVIDRDWRTYADKRVVHFLYFYGLWLVIQSGLKYGQLSGGTPLGFAAHLAFSLIEPYSTLWFIYILAVFSIATKLLRRVPPPVLLAAAVALQVMPIDTSWFLLNEFCERWVYFLVGYLFATRVLDFAAAVADRPQRAGIGLAVWALVSGGLALAPITWKDATTLAELPGISLVLGIAGALAVIAVAALITQASDTLGTISTRIAGALRYCGRNSISIYLAFFLPMAITRTVLIGSGLVSDIGTISLATTVVAVITPLLFERFVRHTPLFFLFKRPALMHLPAAKTTPPHFQPAE
jgi:uncharacterized membrane protein YcfT